MLNLGHWREGIRSFMDISPSNGIYKIDSIKVDTISAKWCNNNITLKIYLQNELLGHLLIDREECECFTCPHSHSFTKTLSEFTKYNYGGINNLRVDSGLKC